MRSASDRDLADDICSSSGQEERTKQNDALESDVLEDEDLQSNDPETDELHETDAMITPPHLHIFLTLLGLKKRPRADAVFIAWIQEHYNGEFKA